MIYIQLQGGLGNQMFQYALGRSLSLDHKQKLVLDLSFLNDKTPRKNFTYRDYELGCFDVQASLTHDALQWVGLKNRLPAWLKMLISGQVITEEYYSFNPIKFRTRRRAFISGLWQSPKYFQHNSDFIKRDFGLAIKLSDESGGLLRLIRENNAVGIHVRRGDYLGKPLHHVCPLEYYSKAINEVKSKTDKPIFLVFSDDIIWVKDNLRPGPDSVYVEHRGRPHYEDLYLMSQCKHNIIANSSFSWWAAWLNDNPNKIVLYPCKWFNKPGWDTGDLFPGSWNKITY